MPVPERSRKLIAKNSLFNLVGQLLPMLVGVVTIPFIVRGLGPNGYGIFSIATLVLGYFSIFDLGLSRATVKFVAENHSPDRVHRVPGLVWTSLSLLLCLGCTGGLIAAAFVPYSVTHLFKMPPSFYGEARAALFILCGSMPVMLVNDALRGVLEAAQRFDLINYVKVPSSVLFYGVAALVIPLGVHVQGIVLLLVLIRLSSACAYLLFCFKVFPELRTRAHFSRAALKPLAVFGGWIMVSNVTGPVFGYLERFMIASVLSLSWLTFYSAPYDLISKMLIFPAAVVPSLFPYFSYHSTQKTTEVSEVTAHTIKYLLLVLTPIVAIFLLFARPVLHHWLGSDFAANSTVPMQIISLVFFLNAFAMIPYTSVQALGRPDLKAILDVSVLPAYVLVSWLLMHRWGITGAALAKLLITIADCTFLYVFASRMKAFVFRDFTRGPLLRAVVSSAAFLLLAYLLQAFRLALVPSMVLAAIGLVGYAALFWFTVMDRADRLAAWSLAGRAVAFRRQEEPALSLTGSDS